VGIAALSAYQVRRAGTQALKGQGLADQRGGRQHPVCTILERNGIIDKHNLSMLKAQYSEFNYKVDLSRGM
jgi:hypothetical protein